MVKEMLCKICNTFFNERRRLIDLFRTKEFHVCNNCLNKYPFKIEYSFFPLDYYQLEIISLFEKDQRINYNAFFNEYSEIYKKLIELNPNKLVIFTEKFYVSEEILLELSQVSTLLDNDIILLTNILIV